MHKATPVQVGLFVVLGAALAITFYGVITGGPFEALKYKRIHVIFDDVQGLSRGAPVLLSGVNIGEVEEIVSTPENRADVALKIKRSVRLFYGYRFTIAPASLLGDQRVEVKVLDQQRNPLPVGQPVPDGGVVEGVPPIGVSELLSESQALIRDLRATVQTLNLAVGGPDTIESAQAVVRNAARLTDQGVRLLEGVNASFTSTEADVRRLVRNLSGASEEVARLARAGRRPVERLLQSSAGAAQTLERLVKANEKEISALLQRLASLASNAQGVVAENRASLQATLAHTSRATEQIGQLLAATQQEWPALLSEVRHSVQALNQIADATSEDWQAVARNLRSSSAALDESLRQAQPRLEGILGEWEQASQELRRLTETTRQVWVDQGGAQEVRQTLTTMREAVEEVRQTAASLGELLEDPQLPETLKGALAASRTTMEEAGSFLQRANQALDQGLFSNLSDVKSRSEFDFQWAPRPGRFTTDLDLFWFWPRGGIVRLGLADVGEGNLSNLQVGRQITPRHALRLGLYRSKIGIGWDARWSQSWSSSLEFYDPNQGILQWEQRFRISPRWWLLGGVQEVFDRPELFLGVRFGDD